MGRRLESLDGVGLEDGVPSRRRNEGEEEDDDDGDFRVKESRHQSPLETHFDFFFGLWINLQFCLLIVCSLSDRGLLQTA